MLFSIVDAAPKPHAASPTIVFRVKIQCHPEPVASTGLSTSSGRPSEVEAMVLRAQIRIEPKSSAVPLHAFAWTDVPVMVPAFANETHVDVNVPCTYDFDVTATRFFTELGSGDIPLRFFFNGSIFRATQESFSVEMLSWSSECTYHMPLDVWRGAMKACYGDSVLIRIDRATFERLHHLRTQTGATSWDGVL